MGKTKETRAVLVAVLVDRSGSMRKVASDMDGGIATFMEGMADTEHGVCTVTLADFDANLHGTTKDWYRVVYADKQPSEVPEYHLIPRGMTALYDAMGRLITDTEKIAGDRRVIMLIVTDGYNNASQEYTKAAIKAMVEAKTALGWDFSFLGANMDAMAEGGGIGVAAAASMDYMEEPVSVRNTWEVAALSVNTARGYSGQSVSYSPEQRAAATSNKPMSQPGNESGDTA